MVATETSLRYGHADRGTGIGCTADSDCDRSRLKFFTVLTQDASRTPNPINAARPAPAIADTNTICDCVTTRRRSEADSIGFTCSYCPIRRNLASADRQTCARELPLAGERSDYGFESGTVKPTSVRTAPGAPSRDRDKSTSRSMLGQCRDR